MAEPFKNNINEALLRRMADHLRRVRPSFPDARFLALCKDGLDTLELKERVVHVRKALSATLPGDFPEAADLLEAALAPATPGDDLGALQMGDAGIAGWPVWPMTDYVAAHGLGHFDRALAALAAMTQRFSSEFAVRAFLEADPARTLAVLKTWLDHPSPHVRRLVSEGSRPRLPWGLRLRVFVADPGPCVPLLDALHADPSEYVRRSVANHLNDISKDHPALAVDIARRWLALGAPTTARLVGHALRSLVKAGHAPSLSLLGFGGAKDVELRAFSLSPKALKLGGSLTLSASLENTGKRPANLVIDYAVHHVKARGGLSAKVFKGLKRRLGPGETTELRLTHGIKKVTTRRYHPGRHKIELLVNGRPLAEGFFTLKP
jgi:3-methyladenine DNA glycosylase AlkC